MDQKPLPLPDDIITNMLYGRNKNYPLIKIGEYENFIQKFMSDSAEGLFEAIRNAKNFGQKAISDDNGHKVYLTQGAVVDGCEYVIVQPDYPNFRVDFPHYFCIDLHISETETKPEYYTYISFIPKHIFDSIPLPQ